MAQKLLAGIPLQGTTTPAALRAKTGIAADFYPTLQELEAKNYVTVTRFGQDPLTITSIARR